MLRVPGKALDNLRRVNATVSFDAGTSLITLWLRVQNRRRHRWRSFLAPDYPVVDEQRICEVIARFITQAGPWEIDSRRGASVAAAQPPP